MEVRSMNPKELRREIINQIEWSGLYLLEHAEDFVPTEDSGALIVDGSLYLNIDIQPLEQLPKISTGIDYIVPTRFERPCPTWHGKQTRERQDG